MSFGWSVGDLIQGANIAWSIYESLGAGTRSAKNEFAAFRIEFNLVKCALEKLQGVTASCPGEDLDLGKGYDQTLARCASFIKKHKTLSEEARGRRPSFHEKILGVWEKVSWPLEREEAERLRRYLERYVQIAILKMTANTSDVTRRLARASEQSRIDHLETLKAVRTMSVQVSSILRRCLPDGAPNDPALDVKYLARLQHRHLSTLLDPWPPGLHSIPENDVLSQSDSQAALQRIQEITDRLGHLAMRLDTMGRQATPSPERHQSLKRVYTSDSIGSDTTIVAPVVDLLNQIGEEVREALDKVGYEHVVVPGQQQSDLHPGSGKSTKLLNNAAEDWDQFKDWLQFQLVHSLEVPPPPLDLGPPLWRQPSPEPPSPAPKIPSYSLSPPRDLQLQHTLSPPQLPQGYELGVSMSRTSSSESYYPRSPSSVDSLDRRSSIQPLLLTHHPVQVLFPDRHRANCYVHPPVTCQVVVYLHPRTNDPELIEGTNTEAGIKFTHSLDRERPSKTAESSMIPYLPYSGYSSSASRSPLSIRFMGSHRLRIEQDGTAKKWHISPVYICQDKQDFDTFQSTLLRRRVTFCGYVKSIKTSGQIDHCSQETVRILQDPITGTSSILYFASKRGSSNALPGFLDGPVSDFLPPQRAGKRDIRLPLLRAQQQVPRRNSVESSTTTLSQDSRTSRNSTFSVSGIDTGWKKEKWIQFNFESERESEAFIKALKAAKES